MLPLFYAVYIPIHEYWFLVSTDPSIRILKEYYSANRNPNNLYGYDYLYFNIYLSDGTMHVNAWESDNKIRVSLTYS